MIEIHLGIGHKGNKIVVDGKDISNQVTGIKIEKTASTIPVVELELIPSKVKITGDATLIRDKGLKEYDTEELRKELDKRDGILNKDGVLSEDTKNFVNKICSGYNKIMNTSCAGFAVPATNETSPGKPPRQY